MTRGVMTPAILRVLATAMVAGGMAAGCSGKGTATGRFDAQAPGLDAAVGSGGAAGSGSGGATAGSGGSGGVTGSGGLTATAGSTRTGGVTGVGGSTGAGGSMQGSTGAGGSMQTGGTTGAGGATSSGESSASGGSGGRGGTGGGGSTGGGGASGTGGPDASADKPPVREGTPCSSQDDCAPSIGNDLACYSPADPGGSGLGSSSCGACMGISDCASDADCARDGGTAAGTVICDVVANMSCVCYRNKFCVLGCRTIADCTSGQACNQSNRCEKTCVPGDGTCPVDFTCNGSGFCQRDSCKSDSECSAFCVNGACYQSRGTCEPIPA